MRLVDIGDEPVSRGAVFRFPSHIAGHSEYVTLMLVLHAQELCMVSATGPKAGHVLLSLPDEALTPGTRMTTGTWLVDNWQKWVWPECAPTEVDYLPHLAEPGTASFTG